MTVPEKTTTPTTQTGPTTPNEPKPWPLCPACLAPIVVSRARGEWACSDFACKHAGGHRLW